MTSVRVPVPEFLSTRRDLQDSINPWTITRLAPFQGGNTDIAGQKMSVPFGTDAYSSAVRVHEMMHAKISPAEKAACGLFPLPADFVEAGEEFRVNTMLDRAGFDANALKSGTEHAQGERAAQSGDWNGMVYAVGVLAGTDACKDFVAGVASVNAERAAALAVVEEALVEAAAKIPNEQLADTTPSKTFVGVPRGFTRYTRMFAEILTTASTAEVGGTDTDGEPVEFDDSPASAEKMEALLQNNGAGTFAALILDKSVVLDRRLSGKLGRKKIATDIGRNPRRIERMLTDPHRRVFDRYTKGQGGVVLIDQSGSMALDSDDINAILEAAPGCVIIGYSHQNGSTDVPNVWVLADRGKVASDVREGNGGNGVDGPAVRFAQSKRKTGEPFVWVCDGTVTDDKFDAPRESLDTECAELVVRYGIHMVYNTRSAIKALKECAAGRRLEARAIGHVADTDTWRKHQGSAAA
jgi:hypothetical protein